MHDYVVSKEIAELVLRQVEQTNARRVLSLALTVGQFSHLNPEQLRYWLQELFRDTPAEGAEIAITMREGTLRCTECGHEQHCREEAGRDPSPLAILATFQCQNCGATTCELAEGKECILERIQIEQAS